MELGAAAVRSVAGLVEPPRRLPEISSSFATWAPSARVEDRPGDRAKADQPRANVGADHRPDLGDEGRFAAEDLVAVGGQRRGRFGVLDVLDDPGVGARFV